MILDRNKFKKQVLKTHFNGIKYTSFLRQMNLYGFTHLNLNDRTRTVYVHRYFVKGHPRLLARIIRLTNVSDTLTTNIMMSGF